MSDHRARVRWIPRALAAAALAVAAVLAGCQLGPAAAASEDAQAVAQEMSDPGSGITQEIGDVGGVIAGTTGVKGAGSFARWLTPWTAFSWVVVNNDYERTESNLDLTFANGTVHVDSLSVTVAFYSSTDGTGTPIQPGSVTPLDSAVHSIRYHRAVSGTTSVPAKGMTAAFTATTDLLFSSVDAAAGTATVTGTHTRTFDRTFTTGRTVQGSVTYTLSSMTIAKDPQSGALSWSGSLSWTWDATITRANGTTVTRQRTGTADFSGTGTCTVTTDGETSTYNVSDGSPA